ncbi:uncharacterized protein [Diabrotica undecimpunctata]|uniref:uncharacterized protein n=1 Tax=Diabrotica undecimpunctata TaxID=50387 RepID=UPI003B6427EE
MSRGKKMIDMAIGQKPQTLGSTSNCDPNTVVHVLEDVQLQYQQLGMTPEIGSYIPYPSCTSSVYNVDITPVTSENNFIIIPSQIEKEYIPPVTSESNLIILPSQIEKEYITQVVSENNLIIIPSQIEKDFQTTNILISKDISSSAIQSIEKISHEPSLYSLQAISNTPDETPSVIDNMHAPDESILPLVNSSHQVVPNLPISDDSDTEHNKLVPYSDSDSDSLSEIRKSYKRKKRFQVNKKDWFSEKNKDRRECGKSYFGRQKKEDYYNYMKPKEARSIKPRCTCKIGKYSTLKCETIDENSRKDIFKQFWSFTWGEKKTLVNEWVTTIETMRPRNRNTKEITKRANTFIYHLKVNNEKVKVCRTMFLNTLDLGRWTVKSWKKDFTMQPPSILRRHNQPSKSVVSQPKQSLFQFLDSLPVMEAHYCRATSQKLYLLPEWKSKESLYQFYVNDWCKNQNIKPLSIALFSNEFEGKNFALFRPKKDQCEKCTCYKVGTITEEQHRDHIEKVNQAREEKDKDKKGENYVFAVDLQAVLMAPKSNVSTLYYKTKLQVHNLCFFNLKNKEGNCFIWNEVEGGLNAEEFVSIWVDFLENNVISNIAKDKNITIILYSDGCTYQNRNCILSNALLNIVLTHTNITIEQKFLEVDHTQMEVDSMHSTIERQLKNKIINIPAEYISIVKHARKLPAPYVVKYLEHTYFKKFEKIQFFKSIRPGRSKGDPKVTDIRALRYESNGSILYKTFYKDKWQPLPQRRSSRFYSCKTSDLTQLHQNRRKITLRKFEDLQEIKKTLPSDYHKYYDDLPHE